MLAKTWYILIIVLAWSFGCSTSFTTSIYCNEGNFGAGLKCRQNTALYGEINANSGLAHQNSETSQSNAIYIHLLKHFQGDFDNYRQVVTDREENLTPREGGGHENFHCTLIPLSKTSRLAAFYFDGNPERIFRFRYYELLLPTSMDEENLEEEEACIEMKLYTLHPDLERELRSCSEEPLRWPDIFDSFEAEYESDKIKYLPNCEIRWSVDMDPVEHAYALDHKESKQNEEEQDSIHAVMKHGEAIVDSTIIPGVKIRILDQLSLYEDTFYINDRGLDPESGAFIYGNQRGVPYRLNRVTRMVQDEEDQWKRQVVDDDLKWTIGKSWRSSKEYGLKIEAIGGISAAMSGKKPPSSN